MLAGKKNPNTQSTGQTAPTTTTTTTNQRLRVRLDASANVTLLIPAANVRHVPTLNRSSDVLVLCPSCDPRVTQQNAAPACAARGAGACPFVHADARNATAFGAHERAAATTGAYERFSAGKRARLTFPGGVRVTVPSDQVLRTRAAVHPRRAAGVCEHYALRGRCERGAACTFAHPVSCDAAEPQPSTKRHPSLGNDDGGHRDPSHLASSSAGSDDTTWPSPQAEGRAAGSDNLGSRRATTCSPRQTPACAPTAAQRRVRHYPYDAVPLLSPLR
eukprot:CAMPEP_0174856564 /NCGR_PEP_ID=MMETSP1114-20130205/36103_1 /TAXON_ID=312471 /ORGANISM="Neobodo designis, Strain CCAP 1951/1" /LENGTH=274 /DNA_ID=CAMNT_0016091365 /DNA_START=254 /DNA_END=1078 /DNA_ORIENTATION=-